MKFHFTIKVDNQISSYYSIGNVIERENGDDYIYCKLSKFIIIGISHVTIDEMDGKLIIEGDCISPSLLG